MKIKSRVVSVSTIRVAPGTLAMFQNAPIIPSQFVTIKWFHSADYEKQESLNDASEIFADSIFKDVGLYHVVLIEQTKERTDESKKYLSGYDFETVRLQHKEKIF